MISINWATKVISIPRTSLTLIQQAPTEIRQLNLNSFRLELKDIEDSEEGIAFEKTHKHNTAVTVSGVTLGRVIEMVNGYTITFEDGQYAVNLVGANSNCGDVVNVNQVSVRTANSAGLQDLATLMAAAYQGEVCVDVLNGQAGTDTPVGTRAAPVSNFLDAKRICEARGIRTIRIKNAITLADCDFSAGFVFTGDNPITDLLTLVASANIRNCVFENLTLQGVVDGNNLYQRCICKDMTYSSGFFYDCSLDGVITIVGGELLTLLGCFSNRLAGQNDPEIDMGGNGQLIVRGYNGALLIKNHNDDSGDGDTCIDMASGVIKLEPSITAGLWPIRGICTLLNNATGNANVIDRTLNQAIIDNASDPISDSRINELWKLAGLDATKPQTITDTSISVDDINLSITQPDGLTTQVSRS